MNNLIKITTNENQEPIISGRELHEFLEVETPYHIWFPRMVEYGFTENVDFIGFEQKCTKPHGGRPSTDHAIKIDMAKEIAMIQRSEKGKQARQYFIQVEKDFNSPEKIMARALQIAERELSTLRLENKEMKPKALFADAVSASHTSILVGEMAKILRQNGVDIGQNRLFSWLRENGFLMKQGESKNMPTQKAMDLGLFEVKETTISNPDGSIRITKTAKITGKGQIYFINKLLKEE